MEKNMEHKNPSTPSGFGPNQSLESPQRFEAAMRVCTTEDPNTGNAMAEQSDIDK